MIDGADMGVLQSARLMPPRGAGFEKEDWRADPVVWAWDGNGKRADRRMDLILNDWNQIELGLAGSWGKAIGVDY